MKFGHFLSTVVALGLAVPAQAQDAAGQAKLDAKLRAAEKWLETYLEQEAVPGASVAIARSTMHRLAIGVSVSAVSHARRSPSRPDPTMTRLPRRRSRPH